MTLRNAWETVICRKRQGSTAHPNRVYAGTQCTWQPARVACGVLKPSAQQQGVQEVQEVQEVQNAKRSRQLLAESCIHEFMHARCISCMLDRRVWHTQCSWCNSCTRVLNLVHNPQIRLWIPSWYSCVLNLYRWLEYKLWAPCTLRILNLVDNCKCGCTHSSTGLQIYRAE